MDAPTEGKAMSEMVERVARALCDRDPDGTQGGPMSSGIWLDEGEANWTAFTDKARAAIAAMREPTAAMLEAAGGERPRETAYAWQAMLDAALKD